MENVGLSKHRGGDDVPTWSAFYKLDSDNGLQISELSIIIRVSGVRVPPPLLSREQGVRSSGSKAFPTADSCSSLPTLLALHDRPVVLRNRRRADLRAVHAGEAPEVGGRRQSHADASRAAGRFQRVDDRRLCARPGADDGRHDAGAGGRRRWREDARGKLGALVAERSRGKGGTGKGGSVEHPAGRHRRAVRRADGDRLRARAPPTSTSIRKKTSSLVQLRVDGVLETLRKLPKSIHNAAHQPLQSAVADGHRRAAHGAGRAVLPMPGPAAAADPHPRRDPAHDARRTAHAAAARGRDRAAHAQPAGHVGPGAANVRRRTPRRSKA